MPLGNWSHNPASKKHCMLGYGREFPHNMAVQGQSLYALENETSFEGLILYVDMVCSTNISYFSGDCTCGSKQLRLYSQKIWKQFPCNFNHLLECTVSHP